MITLIIITKRENLAVRFQRVILWFLCSLK